MFYCFFVVSLAAIPSLQKMVALFLSLEPVPAFGCKQVINPSVRLDSMEQFIDVISGLFSVLRSLKDGNVLFVFVLFAFVRLLL